MPTWDSVYLDRLWSDANEEILRHHEMVLARFSLAVTVDVEELTLPNYVRRIIRVTWLGKQIDPISKPEADIMFKPDSSPSGEPRYYLHNETDYYNIRLLPAPNQSLAEVTTGLDGPNIGDGLVISCYRNVDASDPKTSLPDYLERYVKKAYVMHRAFLKEGQGQNLGASDYFFDKFKDYINLINDLKSNIFRAKRHVLGMNFPDSINRRPNRPRLPDNFPRY